MANTNTAYGRDFNAARKAQGFTSQAQLDGFFAHYDHMKTCADCKALDGHALLDDGYQPTVGECGIAKNLYREYLRVAQ